MRARAALRWALLGAVLLPAPFASPAGAADAAATFADLAREAEARGALAVRGEGDFLFLTSELRHLSVGSFWGEAAVAVSRASRPEWADPRPAILDFARQLDEAGVELLFVPVPAKAAVVPEAVPGLAAPAVRIDAADAAFYQRLREEGIEVLDLQPLFAGASEPASQVCHTDSHWSGEGAVAAARAIAERVRARPWYAELAHRKLESEVREVEIRGDLVGLVGEPEPARERLPLRFVGTRSGDGLLPVEPSRESPVLLLADSHGLVFHAGGDMHAQGAGLPDQLALELGLAVDLLAVRGSGATPSRMGLARRPGGLDGKRLVVWVLSAREFTEASQGWREVPVVR